MQSSARGSRSRGRALITVVLATVLGVGVAAANDTSRPQPARAGISATADRASTDVTADALPTVQVNGIVWTQVVVGNTVYAGGQFGTARPAGSAPGRNTVRRTNLLAYDVRTGKLITAFAPVVNGAVRTLAVSPDKRTLYLGGAFTAVNGKKRARFAALVVGSGALRPLAPSFDNQVRAIVATSSTVYVGGTFGKVGKSKRSRLAAVSAMTGKARSWKPTANGDVFALTLTPDRRSLVAGGSFSKVGRSSACGMSRLSLSGGAVQSWPINSVVRNCGDGTAILSLTADRYRVYGSGYNYRGKGNYEGVFAATGAGRLSWLQDCRGDTYDVAVTASRVYSVGHAHNCANIGGFPETKPRANYRALAATINATGTVGSSVGGFKYYKGKPSPSLVNWFPNLTPGTVTGQTQAAWSVEAVGPYVVLGGEFTAVNGVPQQGLVRMAAAAYAPHRQGPLGVTSGAKPTPVLNADGSVTIAWKTGWDRDNRNLTYTLVRDDVALTRRSVTSVFWNRTAMTFRDVGVPAGQKHVWRVVVSDPDGNQVSSLPTALTIPPAPTPTPDPTTVAPEPAEPTSTSAPTDPAPTDPAPTEPAPTAPVEVPAGG